jgi:hypothetical protein
VIACSKTQEKEDFMLTALITNAYISSVITLLRGLTIDFLRLFILLATQLFDRTRIAFGLALRSPCLPS